MFTKDAIISKLFALITYFPYSYKLIDKSRNGICKNKTNIQNISRCVTVRSSKNIIINSNRKQLLYASYRTSATGPEWGLIFSRASICGFWLCDTKLMIFGQCCVKGAIDNGVPLSGILTEGRTGLPTLHRSWHCPQEFWSRHVWIRAS